MKNNQHKSDNVVASTQITITKLLSRHANIRSFVREFPDIKFTCYQPIVWAAINSYTGCSRFNHVIARALLNRRHYIVRASFANACKYEKSDCLIGQ